MSGNNIWTGQVSVSISVKRYGLHVLYSIIRMFELLLKLCMPVKIIIDIIFWTGIGNPGILYFYNINSGIIRWYRIVMIISGAVYMRGGYMFL